MTVINEVESRNIGGYQPATEAFDDDVPEMFNGDLNADRFSSHVNQDDNEEADDAIEDDFEEGEPMSMDDLDLSPERPAKEVKMFARRGAHITMHEKTYVRPGTP